MIRKPWLFILYRSGCAEAPSSSFPVRELDISSEPPILIRSIVSQESKQESLKIFHCLITLIQDGFIDCDVLLNCYLYRCAVVWRQWTDPLKYHLNFESETSPSMWAIILNLPTEFSWFSLGKFFFFQSINSPPQVFKVYILFFILHEIWIANWWRNPVLFCSGFSLGELLSYRSQYFSASLLAVSCNSRLKHATYGACAIATLFNIMLVMMAQRLARRDWRSVGPRFKSHPRLTFQSWSSYQLNQLGSEAASDSTLKQLITCGVSNTCTLLYNIHSKVEGFVVNYGLKFQTRTAMDIILNELLKFGWTSTRDSTTSIDLISL